jgi:hypothetical protein
MTRQRLRSRVLLGTCAYVFAVAAVVGAALSATIALTAENASAVAPQVSAGKIGPGYARRPPVNLGKPEKVVESTPYRPHTAKPGVSGHKQLRPIIAARPATAGPPMKIAEVAQSASSRPAIQRFH